MSNSEHSITQDVVNAARANPNGWVYKIDGVFGENDHIPPEAIIGAWKVDANGSPTGEFIVNPKYRPRAPESKP